SLLCCCIDHFVWFPMAGSTTADVEAGERLVFNDRSLCNELLLARMAFSMLHD
ncbi:Hypothetical predicted protein, partial [Paramuricea clavata]